MKDFLNIGSTPPAEDCAQLGEPNYSVKATVECHNYIKLLKRTMGEPPEGAELKVKWFNHDFGRYCEVVCEYDDSIPEAVDYAFRCESEGPQEWDGKENG